MAAPMRPLRRTTKEFSGVQLIMTCDFPRSALDPTYSEQGYCVRDRQEFAEPIVRRGELVEVAAFAKPHVAHLIRVNKIVVEREPCLTGSDREGLRLNAAQRRIIGQQALHRQSR